jgi:hypothetical protein
MRRRGAAARLKTILVAYREPDELPELDEELAPPDEDEEDDEEDPFPPELDEPMPGCWLLTPGLAPGAMGAVGAEGVPGAAAAPGEPDPWPPPAPPALCALASSIEVPAPTASMAMIATAVVNLEALMVVPFS